jgi:hypothetical protein
VRTVASGIASAAAVSANRALFDRAQHEDVAKFAGQRADAFLEHTPHLGVLGMTFRSRFAVRLVLR